jgi:hypothetical protein
MKHARKPWDKHQPNARTCKECGSQRPGMQPLAIYHKDGRRERGYWHLKCFEIARKRADNK